MDLTVTRHYAHPPQAVWTALTVARAIRQWWLDTDFAPVVGREFFFQDEPRGSWDGRVTGRVLEADEPRRIRFTWVGGGVDTVVDYRVAATSDGGTDVTLAHQGFAGLRGLFVGTMLRFGWRGFVASDLPEMAAHVATRGIDVPFPRRAKAERAA